MQAKQLNSHCAIISGNLLPRSRNLYLKWQNCQRFDDRWPDLFTPPNSQLGWCCEHRDSVPLFMLMVIVKLVHKPILTSSQWRHVVKGLCSCASKKQYVVRFLPKLSVFGFKSTSPSLSGFCSKLTNSAEIQQAWLPWIPIVSLGGKGPDNSASVIICFNKASFNWSFFSCFNY